MTYKFKGKLWDTVPIVFSKLPQEGKEFVYTGVRNGHARITDPILKCKPVGHFGSGRYAFETLDVSYVLQVDQEDSACPS